MPRSFDTIFMGAAGSSGGSYWISVIGETQAADGGNAGATQLTAIAVDSEANAYSVGRCYAATTPSSMGAAACIIKHDTDGAVLFNKDLYASASGVDRGGFTGVDVNSSDEPYVFGEGFFPDNNLSVVLKYNTSGVLQFMKGLSSVKGEFKGGGVSPAGNPYGVGYLSGLVDLTYHRFNSSGAIQQGCALNNDFGIAYDIGFDSSNNAYIYGRDRISTNRNDLGIFKVNTSDAIQWGKVFTTNSGEGNVDVADNGIAVEDSGSVFISGYENNAAKFHLLKLAQSNGSTTWNKTVTISGGTVNLNFALAVDSDGNVYVFGDTTTASSGTGAVRAATIIKFNSSGAVQWANKLTTTNGTEGTRAKDITIDSNGDIRILMQSKIVNSNYGSSSQVAKLPSDGSLTAVYGDWTYVSIASSLTVGNGDLASNAVSTRALNTPSYGDVGNVAGDLSISLELVEL